MQKYLFSSLILISGQAIADHASVSFETGTSGAIMTTSATTLEQGKTVAGFAIQFLQLEEISDAQLEAAGAREEDIHSVNSLAQVAFNLAYGITSDWTAGFSIPFISRDDVREAHHDAGAGEAEFAGDSEGFGDARLFSQYRFYSTDKNHAALILGLKIPTGDTDELEAEGGLFETEQQPGSGSWDPFIGLAYDHAFDRLGVSGNVLYTFVTDGSQGVNLGNSFNYNLAVTYRIFSPVGSHDHHHHKHGLGIIDSVDMMLELNGDYRDRESHNFVNDENTGGHTLYLSPGLRAGIGHSWSVYTSVGIPVVNDLNGQQSEPDYRIIGGISKRF